jgi:hypothetical protein
MARFSLRYLFGAWCLLAWVLATPVAGVEPDLVASKSLTIQSSGPRPGIPGSNYFNIEGKKNDRFASFGVLVFAAPKGETQVEFKELTLKLVQSIPDFAHDGKLQFFLAEPAGQDQDFLEKLMFDATSAFGVARNAFRALHPLGAGIFKKAETGRVDTFNFTLGDSARKYVADQFNAGGAILVVVAPDDEQVAATYFGAGNETEANRPRISLGRAPTK